VKEYGALSTDAPELVAVPLERSEYKGSIDRPSTRAKFDVVDGKHRLLVAKKQGFKTVPVWIPKGSMKEDSVWVG
jgi:hypothetical protein